jgi:hypothetical protein
MEDCLCDREDFLGSKDPIKDDKIPVNEWFEMSNDNDQRGLKAKKFLPKSHLVMESEPLA